jgi:phage-related protein
MSFTPSDSAQVKQIDSDSLQGTLRIEQVSNVWRFVVAESTGGTAVFSSITIPLTNLAPDAVPKPFYFRFLRELPSTGTGSYHLVVNDGTTTQTQTLTGANQPAVATPLITTFGIGSGGILNMFWFRGLGSSTTPTVGDLQSTYWSSPVVFSTTSYLSHSSASVIDSGTDDRYWHELDVPDGPLTGLKNTGGSSLQVRFSATNTAPTSAVSFTGSYVTLQNIPEPLNDAQGRYLQLELKFNPGSEWPLSSGQTIIAQDTNTVLTASHFATPSSTDPVALPVTTEGSSQGTLPHSPETSTTTTESFRVHRVDFDSPYTLARNLSSGSRRSYQVRWLLTSAEKDTLVSFFEARDGNGAFTWTPPGESTTSLAALTSDLRITQLNPNAFELEAELIEVL